MHRRHVWLTTLGELTAIAVLLAAPFAVRADVGSFTEDFGSLERREERTSFAAWDTRNRQLTLPLAVTARDFSPGLTGFNRAAPTVIAADGGSIFVATAATAYIVSSVGSAQDVSSYIATKTQRITGAGYLGSRSMWVVGGDAKSSIDGPMLYTVNASGLGGDFQAQAKTAGITRLESLACGSTGCLIVGNKISGRGVFFFDGTTVTDVTAGLPFDSYTNLVVASSAGGSVAVAGMSKGLSAVQPQDLAANNAQPYYIRVFEYQGSWRELSGGNATSSSSETRFSFQRGNSGYIVTRRDSALKIWNVSGNSWDDISSQFSGIGNRLGYDPLVIGAGSNNYLINGYGGGVFANIGGGIELGAAQVSLLNNASVSLGAASNGKLYLSGSGSNGTILIELSLQGFAPSAAAESRTIASAYSQIFKKATVTIEADVPPGTRIDYFLTSNGTYWENVMPGREHEFKNPGTDLRFKVVLFSDTGVQTPLLRKLKIDYIRENKDSSDVNRNRDSQRLSDLRDVVSALENFKKARASYPVVEGLLPKERWLTMMRLLVEGRFMTRTPVDPKQAPDNDFYYDYLVGNSGQAYVVRARMEDTANAALKNDKDGVFAEIAGSYTCADPWYCEGVGLNVSGTTSVPLVAKPFSPLTDAKPSGISAKGTQERTPISFEVVRDGAGKVWYLGNTLAGTQVKFLIPSVKSLQDRTNVSVTVRSMATSSLNKIPRARLVKILDRNEIFFLTGRWQKRWLPTWGVFKSYKANNLKNVVEVDEAIVNLFNDSRLIRLDGDSRVWFIEGTTKREIPNDRAMRRYNLNWDDVSGMNQTEFNFYQEGTPLD